MSDNELEFTVPIKLKQSKIIGVQWISNTVMLFIGDKGLELHNVNGQKKSSTCLKTINMSINWAVFQHDSSLLIASSGTLGTTLNPFLITASSITRYPKFEVDLRLSANVARLSLLDRDVSIANLYNSTKVLILKHSPGPPQVLVYNLDLAREGVSFLSHRLEIGVGGRLAVQSIDNLIIVHDQSCKTTAAYDLRLVTQGNVEPFYKGAIQIPSDISTDIDSSYEPTIDLYSQWWVLMPPNTIVDGRVGCLWKLQIKLNIAPQFVTDKYTLCHMLSGRSRAKNLLLSQLKCAVENKSMTLMQFGELFAIFASDLKRHHSNQNSQSSNYGCAIEQADLYSTVLHPLIDSHEDLSYLLDVTLQLLLAIKQANLDVQPFIYELLLCCLIQSGQFDKMYQLVESRVIVDSKALAFLLLSAETKYRASTQLAIDMLQRIGTATEEIVEVLLSKHLVIEAIRYVSDCGLPLNCLKMVECAWETGDRHIKYAVFTYFMQHSLTTHNTPHFAKGDRYDRFLFDFKRLYPTED